MEVAWLGDITVVAVQMLAGQACKRALSRCTLAAARVKSSVPEVFVAKLFHRLQLCPAVLVYFQNVHHTFCMEDFGGIKGTYSILGWMSTLWLITESTHF